MDGAVTGGYAGAGKDAFPHSKPTSKCKHRGDPLTRHAADLFQGKKYAVVPLGQFKDYFYHFRRVVLASCFFARFDFKAWGIPNPDKSIFSNRPYGSVEARINSNVNHAAKNCVLLGI